MRISYGRVYFVPVIEGTAARREHNLTKLVSIGEMLLFFGNDELCSRRAAPATQKWSFLTIKKRLRQAASRGKWCFSLRNAILGKKKKAPAASLQPEENGFGPPQQGSHWCSPTREPLVHPNKGAIGSLQQRSHWFTPTKEPLVHPNKGATPSGEKHQKHQNLHKTVIRRTFRARS